MSIYDLVGHYNSAVTQAKPITANKGVEKFSSSIKGLEKGHIFEGTVSSVKGGKVTLALSNGQTISARLDGKVSIKEGQSMFFQVKSNDGSKVEIRPYTAEGSGNPTIMQALKAANLPVQANFISMVNKMMEEQLPIDRGSISTMARLVQDNAGINVDTLVQLQKLGLPIDEQIASSFELYLNDKQAIGNQMEDFISELPLAMADESLSPETLKQMGQDILNIATENLPELPEGTEPLEIFVNTFDSEGELVNSEASAEEAANLEGTINSGEIVNSDGAVNQEATVNPDGTINSDGIINPEETTPSQDNVDIKASVSAPNTLGSVLAESQIESLNNLLKDISPNVKLNNDTSINAVLNEITRQLGDNPTLTKESVIKLFSSDGFKALVKDALEQQWMIKPADVAKGEKLDKLYDQVKNQLDRMENVIKASGSSNSNISNIADGIKGNVEFMNQINEAYTYIQIPLKMSGQNASGELYVYTNKKSIKDDHEELSAFLHLDMDNLGATDVSVKLLGKNVSTNFYLDNDDAYNLLMKFLPQLDERLKEKGYISNINVTNEAKHVNFVDDFLKKDQPTAGKVRRYSFDVRA